jgi:hypothetical protein
MRGIAKASCLGITASARGFGLDDFGSYDYLLG